MCLGLMSSHLLSFWEFPATEFTDEHFVKNHLIVWCNILFNN
jgi:hypothetical protein